MNAIKGLGPPGNGVAYGWGPEEIHFQHPALSLAQIHAALAYYYDNQGELDAEIARQLKEVDSFADAARIYTMLSEAVGFWISDQLSMD